MLVFKLKMLRELRFLLKNGKIFVFDRKIAIFDHFLMKKLCRIGKIWTTLIKTGQIWTFFDDKHIS
jgi:hypothetical protein